MDIDRIASLLWILDSLDEVRSDMSVFHRVDDIESLPAPRFWSFASRLPCYDGAVRAMARIEPVSPPAPASTTPVAAEPLEVWQMVPAPRAGAEVVAPAGAAAMLASYGSAHVSHGHAPLA